jgi:hypothetical protein
MLTKNPCVHLSCMLSCYQLYVVKDLEGIWCFELYACANFYGSLNHILTHAKRASKGHQIKRLKAVSEGQNIKSVSSLQTAVRTDLIAFVTRTEINHVAACEKQW